MTDEERIVWLTTFAAANIQFRDDVGPNKSVTDRYINWANTAVENFRLGCYQNDVPKGVFK